MLMIKALWACLFYSVVSQALPALPDHEVYQTAGVEVSIDPRPHLVERPQLQEEFQGLPEEDQQRFLDYRREMLQKVLEKLKLPKVLALVWNKIRPQDGDGPELSEREYLQVKPLKPFLEKSLQTVSELLWRSYKTVLSRAYEGYSLTVLLTAGTAVHTKLFGYLDDHVGFKLYRGAGLHFSWLVDRTTKKLKLRFRLQTEKMDPGPNGAFMPLNLGFNIRAQKVLSSNGEIPDNFSGRSIVVAPVVSASATEFSAGIHFGLNLMTSPFILGGIMAFVTGNNYWWALSAATPWIGPLGLFENFNFVARTYNLLSRPEPVKGCRPVLE